MGRGSAPSVPASGFNRPRLVELADTGCSKHPAFGHGGSTPSLGTIIDYTEVIMRLELETIRDGNALVYNAARNVKEVAEALGLTLVLPADNELQLDIDTPAQRQQFTAHLGLVQDFVSCVVDRETVSKGGNSHIYLKLGRAISPTERVALQAMLGSDPKREFLSLMRVWYQPELPPSAMFEGSAKVTELVF